MKGLSAEQVNVSVHLHQSKVRACGILNVMPETMVVLCKTLCARKRDEWGLPCRMWKCEKHDCDAGIAEQPLQEVTPFQNLVAPIYATGKGIVDSAFWST